MNWRAFSYVVAGIAPLPAAYTNAVGNNDSRMVVAAISCVFAAAFFSGVAGGSCGIKRALAVVLLAVFTTINFNNALSVIGATRSAGRDGASHSQAVAASLREDEKTLREDSATLRARLGTATIPMLTAEIESLKLDPAFARTRACASLSVTLSESRAVCAKLAENEAKLADARNLEVLAERLVVVRERLRQTAAPEAADSKAASTVAGLQLIGIAADDRRAGVWADLSTALGLEFLAAFAPMFAFWRQTERAPVAVPTKIEPKREKTDDSVKAFISTLSAGGEFRPASELHNQYTCYCRARDLGEPQSPRALGLGLRNGGFEKKLVSGKSCWRAHSAERRLASV